MEAKKQWCTVSDYVTLVRGTTYEGKLVGEPGPALLGLGSIEPGGGFREDHYKTYGGDCPANLMLFPGDLYVSLKGATKDGTMIGSVARVPHTVSSGRLTQDTVKLEFRNPDPEEMSYLYWVLRTPHYRTYCATRATGSAVVALSRQDFLGYPVPPLNFLRKQLVNLFEGIDRKLENLRRQNETLEAIAKTLFKHWFVDFEFPNEDGKPYKSSGGEMVRSELGEIPAGWRVIQLGTLVNTINGYSYKGTDLCESDIALVNLKNFDRNGGFRLDGFKEIITSNYQHRHLVEPNDLLVAHTDLTQNAEVLGNPILVQPLSKYSHYVLTTSTTNSSTRLPGVVNCCVNPPNKQAIARQCENCSTSIRVALSLPPCRNSPLKTTKRFIPKLAIAPTS